RAYHPTLPAPGVAARLLTTADHPSGRLPDPRLGYGIVDPVAAVTAVLPHESGDQASRPLTPNPIRLTLPTPPDHTPARHALLLAGALAAALLLTAARLALRGAHRRSTTP